MQPEWTKREPGTISSDSLDLSEHETSVTLTAEEDADSVFEFEHDFNNRLEINEVFSPNLMLSDEAYDQEYLGEYYYEEDMDDSDSDAEDEHGYEHERNENMHGEVLLYDYESDDEEEVLDFTYHRLSPILEVTSRSCSSVGTVSDDQTGFRSMSMSPTNTPMPTSSSFQPQQEQPQEFSFPLPSEQEMLNFFHEFTRSPVPRL